MIFFSKDALQPKHEKNGHLTIQFCFVLLREKLTQIK